MESADIKNAGLKVTLPRMKILELLENSEDRHLKAEDDFTRSMSLPTSIEPTWSSIPRNWAGPRVIALRASFIRSLNAWP